MPYLITLILKKENNQAIVDELKSYIEEKNGKILSLNQVGETNLSASKGQTGAVILKIEMEIEPSDVAKIKKKISHEKEVISYLLEKKELIKTVALKKKKPSKKIKKIEKKPSQAKKVLDSMQEEEAKIKDLDTTLDKILNE